MVGLLTCDGFFACKESGGDRQSYYDRGADSSPVLPLPKGTVVHAATRSARKRSAGPTVQDPKIDVIWDSALDDSAAIIRRVDRVRLRAETGAVTERRVDSVIIAIRQRRFELFTGQLKMKPTGYVETAPNTTATLGARRLRCGRRHRRYLPPGGHRRRPGLHCGARSGEIPAPRKTKHRQSRRRNRPWQTLANKRGVKVW